MTSTSTALTIISPNPLDTAVLYRVEAACSHGSFDLDGDYIGGLMQPVVYFTCYAFHIYKRTPKGSWIKDLMGKKRWVNLGARKQYATTSEAAAMASFIARKKRQIKILRARLDDAEAGLHAAENGKVKMETVKTAAWFDG